MQMKAARFAIGEKVRIRPQEEILQTLDSDSRLDGCLLTEQMFSCCGSAFIVKRIVRNIFDEYEYRMYATASPMYILDDLICDGSVHEFEHRCDRSCPLLWHESWLEKAGKNGTEP